MMEVEEMQRKYENSRNWSNLNPLSSSISSSASSSFSPLSALPQLVQSCVDQLTPAQHSYLLTLYDRKDVQLQAIAAVHFDQTTQATEEAIQSILQLADRWKSHPSASSSSTSSSSSQLRSLLSSLSHTSQLSPTTLSLLRHLIHSNDPALLASYENYMEAGETEEAWKEFMDTVTRIVERRGEKGNKEREREKKEKEEGKVGVGVGVEVLEGKVTLSTVVQSPLSSLSHSSFSALSSYLSALYSTSPRPFLSLTSYLYLRDCLSAADAVLEAAWQQYEEEREREEKKARGEEESGSRAQEEFHDTLVRLSSRWQRFEYDYVDLLDYIDKLFAAELITSNEHDYIQQQVYEQREEEGGVLHKWKQAREKLQQVAADAQRQIQQIESGRESNTTKSQRITAIEAATRVKKDEVALHFHDSLSSLFDSLVTNTCLSHSAALSSFLLSLLSQLGNRISPASSAFLLDSLSHVSEQQQQQPQPRSPLSSSHPSLSSHSRSIRSHARVLYAAYIEAYESYRLGRMSEEDSIDELVETIQLYAGSWRKAEEVKDVVGAVQYLHQHQLMNSTELDTAEWLIYYREETILNSYRTYERSGFSESAFDRLVKELIHIVQEVISMGGEVQEEITARIQAAIAAETEAGGQEQGGNAVPSSSDSFIPPHLLSHLTTVGESLLYDLSQPSTHGYSALSSLHLHYLHSLLQQHNAPLFAALAEYEETKDLNELVDTLIRIAESYQTTVTAETETEQINEEDALKTGLLRLLDELVAASVLPSTYLSSLHSLISQDDAVLLSAFELYASNFPSSFLSSSTPFPIRNDSLSMKVNRDFHEFRDTLFRVVDRLAFLEEYGERAQLYACIGSMRDANKITKEDAEELIGLADEGDQEMMQLLEVYEQTGDLVELNQRLTQIARDLEEEKEEEEENGREEEAEEESKLAEDREELRQLLQTLAESDLISSLELQSLYSLVDNRNQSLWHAYHEFADAYEMESVASKTKTHPNHHSTHTRINEFHSPTQDDEVEDEEEEDDETGLDTDDRALMSSEYDEEEEEEEEEESEMEVANGGGAGDDLEVDHAAAIAGVQRHKLYEFIDTVYSLLRREKYAGDDEPAPHSLLPSKHSSDNEEEIGTEEQERERQRDRKLMPNGITVSPNRLK